MPRGVHIEGIDMQHNFIPQVRSLNAHVHPHQFRAGVFGQTPDAVFAVTRAKEDVFAFDGGD